MLSETEGDFLTLHEFVKAAKGKLSADTWDYLVGATETETTMLRNRQALDSLAFRPRVLRNVDAIDKSVPFFGRRIALPVMLAPVGGLESFNPEGGAPAARAVSRSGPNTSWNGVPSATSETIQHASTISPNSSAARRSPSAATATMWESGTRVTITAKVATCLPTGMPWSARWMLSVLPMSASI